MINIFLIFLGAGLGGVLRYWVSNGVYWIVGRHFPFGTLMVNASGCFLMGILFVFIIERLSGIGQELRSLLLIGFLGGYTTFSTFSLETLSLYENGDWLGAVLNVLTHIVLCFALTWIGMFLGRQI